MTKPKKKGVYQIEQAKGTGVAYEPTMTISEWAKDRGWDPETRTYKDEESE